MRNKTKHDRISVELVKINGEYHVERATGPYRHAGIIDSALTLLVEHLNEVDGTRFNTGSSYNGRGKMIERYFKAITYQDARQLPRHPRYKTGKFQGIPTRGRQIVHESMAGFPPREKASVPSEESREESYADLLRKVPPEAVIERDHRWYLLHGAIWI